MDQISVSELRKLITPDPDNGLLFWLPRPAALFKDGYRSAVGNAANWNSKYAGKEALSHISIHGYKSGRIFKKQAKAHRVMLALVYGVWPDVTDHINGDRSDNRILNLRSVSVAENNRNLARRISNKSGVTGVCWDEARGKWLATISGRHIGRFSEIHEAALAREIAALNEGYHMNHGRKK